MYTAQENEVIESVLTKESSSSKKRLERIDPILILLNMIFLMLGTVMFLLSKPELHFSLTDNWLPNETATIETKQTTTTVTDLVNTLPTPVASPTPSPTPILSPVTAMYIP